MFTKTWIREAEISRTQSFVCQELRISGRRGRRTICPQHCPDTGRASAESIREHTTCTETHYRHPTAGDLKPKVKDPQFKQLCKSLPLVKTGNSTFMELDPYAASHISCGLMRCKMSHWGPVWSLYIYVGGGYWEDLTFDWPSGWTYHSHSGSHFPGSRLERKGIIETIWMV